LPERKGQAVRLIAALAFGLMPVAALAVGGSDSSPPTQTQTSTSCKNAQVWDEKTKSCVDPKSGQIDDETRFRAVRELAWAGQPEQALIVLATMHEGQSDRVLTYLGFANRKAGRVDLGMDYYAQALEQNPDNLLARSYMGQSLVEQGEIRLAALQLAEIRARGGTGTWAETALAAAVGTGQTFSY
jgi:hypothetical protein